MVAIHTPDLSSSCQFRSTMQDDPFAKAHVADEDSTEFSWRGNKGRSTSVGGSEASTAAEDPQWRPWKATPRMRGDSSPSTPQPESGFRFWADRNRTRSNECFSWVSTQEEHEQPQQQLQLSLKEVQNEQQQREEIPSCGGFCPSAREECAAHRTDYGQWLLKPRIVDSRSRRPSLTDWWLSDFQTLSGRSNRTDGTDLLTPPHSEEPKVSIGVQTGSGAASPRRKEPNGTRWSLSAMVEDFFGMVEEAFTTCASCREREDQRVAG
eukprot:TRINITY_DN12025_c0_g1_i1.p1 TRINITY_DN12025_c0_g1~~TRINITY_DN12025_c0_g1_i1.p1  ORF type:complete len:305 (+),score=52.15 TRINITY_DN12025_c0_g1_i1:119-916(+)